MKLQTVKTYTATIYVGFKERKNDFTYDIDMARSICQSYCNKVGLCVTLTPTEFIYSNGNELGCIVGLIHYPRFPTTEKIINDHAIILATLLKKQYRQCRVSIVTSGETIMLSEDPYNED